mmetsp:Transcript_29847/g.48771  ORF Transcript_29847/g.48771 Transcript_29847/m.48771 type:complete len:97 (+) Transcript_29847:85-375(+)
MGALFGAGEMEEEDGEGAGAAEEQEEVDSEDEGSSQGGEDEDGTPSWVLGGFESAEAEQENFEQCTGRCCRGGSRQRGCGSGLGMIISGLVRNMMK